jgi:hypothetical protein
MSELVDPFRVVSERWFDGSVHGLKPVAIQVAPLGGAMDLEVARVTEQMRERYFRCCNRGPDSVIIFVYANSLPPEGLDTRKEN